MISEQKAGSKQKSRGAETIDKYDISHGGLKGPSRTFLQNLPSSIYNTHPPHRAPKENARMAVYSSSPKQQTSNNPP